jgi:hypothetical protein
MTEPTSAEPVMAWLWEMSDGTRAGVVEHAAPPQWELRIVKAGRVIESERCVSFSDLIAAAMAAHYKAGSRN